MLVNINNWSFFPDGGKLVTYTIGLIFEWTVTVGQSKNQNLALMKGLRKKVFLKCLICGPSDLFSATHLWYFFI